jgi:hypothetical protein
VIPYGLPDNPRADVEGHAGFAAGIAMAKFEF